MKALFYKFIPESDSVIIKTQNDYFTIPNQATNRKYWYWESGKFYVFKECYKSDENGERLNNQKYICNDEGLTNFIRYEVKFKCIL